MNYSEIKDILGPLRLLENEPLAKHTYFKIGGPAQLFFEAKSVEDLKLALTTAFEHQIPYAVIGAFAASFYGVVRASMDADAVISLQSGQLDINDLVHEFREPYFKTQYRKGDFKDPVGAVLNIEDQFNNRVDLLMNIRGVTEVIFSRAVETEFMDTRIRMIGLEDFIAMKMLAGGPKDVSDVIGVLKVSYDRINRVLVRELVQKYGKTTLARLESLLKENKP